MAMVAAAEVKVAAAAAVAVVGFVFRSGMCGFAGVFWFIFNLWLGRLDIRNLEVMISCICFFSWWDLAFACPNKLFQIIMTIMEIISFTHPPKFSINILYYQKYMTIKEIISWTS